MSKKYTKSYEINYHDVDCNLKCKLSSIMNFLCDVGNCQSEKLGDTIEHLVESKGVWVFYKYDIKVHRYPKYRDIITIETKSIGFKKFYAYRGYTIKDLSGNIIVEAIALFFLINIDKRRPMRIPDEKYSIYGEDKNLSKEVEMEDIKKINKVDNEKNFQIRYSDIDSNGHVNNVKYVELAIEAVPQEIISKFNLERVKVIFEKETTYGDIVSVLTEVEEVDERLYITKHLIKSNDGRELTKLEMYWNRE